MAIHQLLIIQFDLLEIHLMYLKYLEDLMYQMYL